MAENQKNEIWVYTPDLDFLGVVDDYTSLQWHRKFFEPGSFTIDASITSENIRLLQPGNIVTMKGAKEAGILEDLTNDENGQTKRIARGGRFLSSYFERRLIEQTFNFSGSVEVAMRELVTRPQLVTGAAPLPMLTLGELRGYTEQVEFQATMKNLQEYLTKLSQSSLIGYGLYPDLRAKQLIFQPYKGVVRTKSQGVGSRVIFSEKYENVNNASYSYNDQMYKTQAVVGGEGEGSARVYVVVGGGSGRELRQVFVDAKDIDSEGLTQAQYRAALSQRGLEALAEAAIAESFECETAAEVNYTYRVNYDLGDIVTIEKESWGVSIDRQLTEILEVWHNGAITVVPTFGIPKPTQIDWSA